MTNISLHSQYLRRLSCIACGFVLVSVCVSADTFYVALDGSNIPPFTSWSTAATNIQNAVDLTRDGDEVLVAPGRYIGKLFNTNGSIYEASGSMISITNAITLQSFAGPQSTTIDVGGRHRRAIYINHPDATVFGFTITLGFARTNMGVQTFPTSAGGGVFCDGGGTVANCILYYNRAGLAGGNAYLDGGGRLINCLVVDGAASFCGGIYCDGGGEIINCTIADNWTTSTNLAGGVWCVNGGTVINSILYNNPTTLGSAIDIYTNGSGWSFAYSRVPAGLPGDGLITNNPLFVDYDMDNFHLSPLSPCVNSGSNMVWMADAIDLDGTPRIQVGTVDMGAYEIPGIYYVATNGLHISPFVTWQSAATNIAAVLDVAHPGTEIIVSNGIYEITDAIELDTNVVLSSVNGAAETIIRASGLNRCLVIDHPQAVMRGFTLTGGRSETTLGGGARISAGLLRDSIISNNYSAQFGGGIELSGGSVENCLITENNAGWGGGGVIFSTGGSLLNCLLYDNSTPASPLPPEFGGMRLGGGGALLLSGGSLINCTVARNHSSNSGGGVFYMSHPAVGFVTTRVENTILYQNVALSNHPNYFDGEGSIQFSHSCTWPAVPAGQDNGGMLTNDPLFVSPSFRCLRVRHDSPCVNAGSNMNWMATATDLDEHLRIYGSTVDIGAYEQIVHYVSPIGTHEAPYTNWITAATNISSAVIAAERGSMVLVRAGSYLQPLDSRLNQPENCILSSSDGPETTFIHAAPGGRCFMINAPGFIVDGFTLTGGNTPEIGGGIAVEKGIVQHCIVTGNYTSVIGGGVWLTHNSVAYACQIMHNTAAVGGGGVAGSEQALFQNCTIISNSTPADLFAGDNRFGGGGALLVSGGSLVSCTIAANLSSNDGGGIYYVPFFGMVPAAVRNSIIFDNTSLSNGMNYFDATGMLSYEYTCTEPAVPPAVDGGNNVFSNPLFAARYQLTYDSPCRNSGSNMVWMLFSADAAGNPRITGDRVDIGAYEFIPEPLTGAGFVCAGLVFLFLNRRGY